MDINATLLGQLLTFALLVWFTMKYVWPPIIKALQTREKKIADGLEAGERGKQDLVNARHKIVQMMNEAKQEASQIIDLANKRSIQIIEQGKQDARTEGMRILDHAREEINREISQAKEVLRKQLASLAVAGAEKIIQRNLDVATQTALLDEFVAEI